jgi:serine/threonine protein kinase
LLPPDHIVTLSSELRVARRDVKSSNILLTRDGTAKVGDVGLAVMTDYFSSASAATGTFAYAAPEILMGKPTTSKVRPRKGTHGWLRIFAELSWHA